MFDSDIANNIYDQLMKNTDLQDIDFIKEFPYSWVEQSNAVIYLGTEENKPLFKIRIERV